MQKVQFVVDEKFVASIDIDELMDLDSEVLLDFGYDTIMNLDINAVSPRHQIGSYQSSLLGCKIEYTKARTLKVLAEKRLNRLLDSRGVLKIAASGMRADEDELHDENLVEVGTKLSIIDQIIDKEKASIYELDLIAKNIGKFIAAAENGDGKPLAVAFKKYISWMKE